MKVVHYLNQFFGGIGGEDKADLPPRVTQGAIGPGRAIQAALGKQGEVVATVICGDNYFTEDIEGASGEVRKLIRPYQPDVLLAGPAFNAGRYGIACGAVCKMAQNQLGIPAVTGMYQENPGLDLYRKDVYIIRTTNSARSMGEAVTQIVNIARKLATNEKIGRPSEEGYFPRGVLINEISDKIGAERVIDMLLLKLQGEPFESEVPRPMYDRMKPAPPIKEIGLATIALVTDGGLVPKGNPDKIEIRTATRFGRYDIKNVEALDPADYEVSHEGYDSVLIKQDPNRLVPVDVLRDLEREGLIGKLYDKFYTTTGVASIVAVMEKLGQRIAEELKAEGVSGVILTSTWGTSTRCGATLAKAIERIGIPTVHICAITPVAQMVGSNRILPGHKIVNPVGNAELAPTEEKKLRRSIVEKALKALQTEIEEQKIFTLT